MATAVFLSSCFSTIERQKIQDEWAGYCGGEERMMEMWRDAIDSTILTSN